MKIKISAQLASWITICLLNSPVSAIGQEQPGKDDYGWLNGRWEGQHTNGQTLEIEMQVKVNEITGQSIFRGRYAPVHQTVTGSVQGDQVRLEVQFSGQNPTIYRCRVSEEKALQCSTKAKGASFETTFTRMR